MGSGNSLSTTEVIREIAEDAWARFGISPSSWWSMDTLGEWVCWIDRRVAKTAGTSTELISGQAEEYPLHNDLYMEILGPRNTVLRHFSAGYATDLMALAFSRHWNHDLLATEAEVKTSQVLAASYLYAVSNGGKHKSWYYVNYYQDYGSSPSWCVMNVSKIYNSYKSQEFVFGVIDSEGNDWWPLSSIKTTMRAESDLSKRQAPVFPPYVGNIDNLLLDNKAYRKILEVRKAFFDHSTTAMGNHTSDSLYPMQSYGAKVYAMDGYAYMFRDLLDMKHMAALWERMWTDECKSKIIPLGRSGYIHYLDPMLSWRFIARTIGNPIFYGLYSLLERVPGMSFGAPMMMWDNWCHHYIDMYAKDFPEGKKVYREPSRMKAL